MANDALVDLRVIRGIASDGSVKNVQTDASGHLLTTASETATTGTPTQAPDVTVDGTVGGITILAANTSRKATVIQNVGAANMRVSVGGTPTATTGLQLGPGGKITLEEPYIPTGAIKAIREGSTSTSASVLEIV